MNDAFRVGGRQGGGYLRAILKDDIDGQRPFLQARRQCFAFKKLHHQKIGAYVVQRADVRVIERRNSARLAFKTIPESQVQNFDRHAAVQASVASAKDFSHTAGAERAFDFIRSQPRARSGFLALRPAEGKP